MKDFSFEHLADQADAHSARTGYQVSGSELHERFFDDQNPFLLAQPYEYKDPSQIEPRRFLYGRTYLRKSVSATIAPGGVGKTALVIAECLAMVTGKSLLGITPNTPCNVWLWCLEENLEEMRRRIQAVALHYGLSRDDIMPDETTKACRLFADSGFLTPLLTTIDGPSGTGLNEDMFEAIEERMIAEDIDALVIDPFISSHGALENDNRLIDMIVKRFAKLASDTSCSIHLVHHTRKANGSEITAEDARGAKSFIDAVRYARVLNRMNEDEGERAGVEDHRRYFRACADKVNFGPPEKATWFELKSVDLGNATEYHDGDQLIQIPSDKVGVVTPWSWPDAFDGFTAADLLKVQRALDGKQARENPQATDWAGHVVGTVLGIDLTDKSGRQRVKTMLRKWIENGALTIGQAPDAKRNLRPIIEVGEWANEGVN